MPEPKRTIKIVITELGHEEKDGFGMHMEGDTGRIGELPVDQLSAAEYWAVKFFQLCMNELSERGVMKSKNNTKREALH